MTGHAARETSRRRSALGAYGEAYAARHLSDGGMVLLDRNWRCDLGEIDLVLRDGRVLVICEVKTRSSTAFGDPLEGVTERKVARLRRLAARWLAEHDVHPADVRIDLVGVLVRPGRTPTVDHVRAVG
jgi:putative endonuclease